MRKDLWNRVLKLRKDDETGFSEVATAIFDLQSRQCEPYKGWIEKVTASTSPLGWQHYADIPRMHISAFKAGKVVSSEGIAEVVFSSSGTSGSVASQHHVLDLKNYLENTVHGFEHFYEPLSGTCILGLLPSYLERSGSSLVAMVDHFIKLSQYDISGTYLHDHRKLYASLQQCKEQNIRTVLIGVSFGLLDFVENYQLDFPELVVMETGGMKGRRAELSRYRLHELLKKGFGVAEIHSEYGMTELLSQGYSRGNGIFYCSPTMRVVITDMSDPLTTVPHGTAGVLNIIDLANIDSCSFIVTDDIGISHEDGSFEVLGRLDQSDIRGCNLMVSDLG